MSRWSLTYEVYCVRADGGRGRGRDQQCDARVGASGGNRAKILYQRSPFLVMIIVLQNPCKETVNPFNESLVIDHFSKFRCS